MLIINPWKNDQLIDLLIEIIGYSIFAIVLSILIIFVFFAKRMKARNFNKILVIDFIIINSCFSILLYWYISVVLYISLLLIAFYVEKMEAIKTYKNEMKGIYDFRLDRQNYNKIVKEYDNVIPNNMEISKYIFPRYQLIIISIFLFVLWIFLVCLFGNNYYFF